MDDIEKALRAFGFSNEVIEDVNFERSSGACFEIPLWPAFIQRWHLSATDAVLLGAVTKAVMQFGVCFYSNDFLAAMAGLKNGNYAGVKLKALAKRGLIREIHFEKAKAVAHLQKIGVKDEDIPNLLKHTFYGLTPEWNEHIKGWIEEHNKAVDEIRNLLKKKE